MSNEVEPVESAEDLRRQSMSEMPKQSKKQGKFKRSDLSDEIAPEFIIKDRFGNEHPEVIELDPEALPGEPNAKRISPVTGNVEDFFLPYAYIVAAGYARPDEDLMEEIKVDATQAVRVRGKTTSKFNPVEKVSKKQLLSAPGVRSVAQPQPNQEPNYVRCPKCGSQLNVAESVQKDGKVTQIIKCGNGNCGMEWRPN